jgi:hypothetical protein
MGGYSLQEKVRLVYEGGRAFVVLTSDAVVLSYIFKKLKTRKGQKPQISSMFWKVVSN